jgi:hypothetical protein
MKKQIVCRTALSTFYLSGLLSDSLMSCNLFAMDLNRFFRRYSSCVSPAPWWCFWDRWCFCVAWMVFFSMCDFTPFARLTYNNEFSNWDEKPDCQHEPNYSPDTQKKTQITAIFRYNVILIFRELNFFEAYSVQYSSRQLFINIFPKAIWEISFHAAIIFIHHVSLHTIKAAKRLLSNVYCCEYE